MSVSLGLIGVASETIRILPIVLTRLDEVTTSSTRFGVEREVPDQVDHLLVVHVVGLDQDPERAREAGLVLERLDVLDDLAALVDPLDRVALDAGLLLHQHPADEQADTDHGDDRGDLGRQAAELDDEVLDPDALGFALGPAPELAYAERRSGHDDPDDHQDHDPDRQQHAEVTDHRHLRDSQRQEGDDARQRGGDHRRRKVGERLADRVLVVVEQHLLLDPVVDLDREVDPEPDQDREPGDRHQREVDPDQTEQREAPQHTDQHRQQREQPPADLEDQPQHDRHHDDRDQAEPQHPALEVVVDLLEVDRRAGHRELEPIELDALQVLEHLLGADRLLVEAGVAEQDHASDGGLLVGEGRRQREPDVALLVGGSDRRPVGVDREPVVAEDQQLVPRRIADLAVLGDGVVAGEADRGVGTAGVGTVRVVLEGRASSALAAGPNSSAPISASLKVSAVSGETTDSTSSIVSSRSLICCIVGEVVAGEQVGHVGRFVGRGEEQDHGFAAEVVLELAVVDRDLRVGVEVAVLTGGELDLGERRSRATR